ncbi:MAG: S41 family peptidase [Saprospiraceae bacterium]|nr:hypothetical protein [Lewinella sp.]
MRYQNTILIACLLYLVMLCSCTSSKHKIDVTAIPPSFTYQQLFDALSDTVRIHFYDTAFIQKTFPQLTAKYREQVLMVPDRAGFDRLVRDYLAEFHTSHTSYHTQDDHTYFHLAGIFEPLPNVQAVFGADGVQYPSIGLLTERHNKEIVVVGVLDGSPAQAAGLLKGDVMQYLDREVYSIAVLRKNLDRNISFPIKRGGQSILVDVTPRMVRAQEEMQEACRQSARLIEKNGKKIAYIHMWSFAGRQYYELLQEQLLYGDLAQADALILDIRDGWGGASPEYLNIFNRNIPNLVFYDRQRQSRTFSTQWRKPVGLLINNGSRSGKEILAYGFKKYNIGPVIGEKTAGAVTAGRIFFLPDNSLLYLAVNEVAIDGEILEGIGVYPDITASDDPITPQDEQLEEAVRVMSEM